MVFSSILFLLFFFPVFLISYYLVPRRFKNLHLLLFSLLFYAWGAPKFIVFVLVAVVSTYYLVALLDKSTVLKTRRWLLAAAVASNLGLLLYFKYANFFIDNVNSALLALNLAPMTWVRIALPIGISFFTFQSLTYAVDVYRRVHQPLIKLSDYVVYILMFPQLIAGPIIRFNTIADQLTERRETWDDRVMGFYRFCIGLGKKVLIANVLGETADEILALNFGNISSLTAWLGILAYTFQIYFDFSGYSDMAIGIGRMIGFKFPENFNSPYVSRSITEFWRRWHITLGAWMKDYLYIPLGGNRSKSITRVYLNLWVVFLISGLWHGASWNFIIWGAFHGLFLILDRLFFLKFLKQIGGFLSTIITFFLAVMGWVIFRIESVSDAMIYYQRLFFINEGTYDAVVSIKFISILVIAIVFSFLTAFAWGRNIERSVFYSYQKPLQLLSMGVLCGMLAFLSICSITSSSFNPFIYFRF